MKFAVNLSEAQIAGLAEYSGRNGLSQAEAIRRGVQLLLDDDARSRREERTAALAATFGLWKARGVDAETYLSELRAEWDR